jgi:brefeldin A-resistance guanine nucleotide exchange factor 1
MRSPVPQAQRTVLICADITALNPLYLAQPFLALIRSPLTSGPITSLALTSLHALVISIFPLYLTPPPNTVAPSTPLQIAIAHITAALSQCRFPSSSPQQDELVLLRLLRVIEALATPLQYSPSNGIVSMLEQMGDESVCELLEVGLGMLARARLSEGLRNTASSSVQVIVRACFARLKTQTPEDVEKLLKAGREAEEERERKEKARAEKAVQADGEVNGDQPNSVEKVTTAEEAVGAYFGMPGQMALLTLFNRRLRLAASVHAVRITHHSRTAPCAHRTTRPFRPGSHRLHAVGSPRNTEHSARDRGIEPAQLAGTA